MDIVLRVQDILLKPRETWPTIASEPGDVASLYKNYLLILAAIPPLAGFIGMSLIGFGFIRIPLMFGLSSMVAQYVLTLVMVYVVALVVDALAPTFGGMRDKLRALKLVVYGSTAAMVGGIFSLLPALSILGLVAALYSIYLFYLGLPVLMRCPQDKAVAYTAVVGVISIVAGLVVGALTVGWRAQRHHGAHRHAERRRDDRHREDAGVRQADGSGGRARTEGRGDRHRCRQAGGSGEASGQAVRP